MKWPSSPPLWLALLVMAFTAWFSEGYHHPDEHFQILEFSAYRMGRVPVADLPWEFAAQIRPGLQPFLAFGLMQITSALGLRDPFVEVFLLRLLSGWALIGVVWAWAAHLSGREGQVKVGQVLRWAVLGVWFVPYLAVRFSSEQWGGLCVAAGLLGWVRLFPEGEPVAPGGAGWRHPWLISIGTGVLLMLSFFFRYQMAFALLGLGAWLLWRMGVRRDVRLTLSQAIGLIAGAGLAACAGFRADVWLYGKWVLAPYNYFAANILENKAAQWGTSPPWFYLEQLVLTAVPPVSVVLLLWLGVGAWRRRFSAVAWSLLFFLLAHLAVGHKEARFLYPMLIPALLLAVPAAVEWSPAGRWGRVFRVMCGVAVVLNVVLLPVRCLLPAQESVSAFRFLYRYAAGQSVPVSVFSAEREVYELVGLPVHIYRSPQVRTVVLPRLSADTLRHLMAPPALVFSTRLTLPDACAGLPAQRVYATLPEWVLGFNPNDWQSRSHIWSFHKVDTVTGVPRTGE